MKAKNLGCMVKGLYVGILMYADDIILMAGSVTELQLMINLCAEELDAIDMMINAKKTMCIRIGRRYKSYCVKLGIGMQPLMWVQQIRYLGIFITSGTKFKIDLSPAKRKFFISSNTIFSKVQRDRADVVLSLVGSNCLPVLMYGLEAVELTRTDLTRLEHPYTMVFHKIFGTYNNSIIAQCQFYMNCLPLSYLYITRQLSFLKRISMSNANLVCSYLFKHFGKNRFDKLSLNYNITSDDSINMIKTKVWTVFADSVN
jgi:hypothetical protein